MKTDGKVNPRPISQIKPSPELEELQYLMPIEPDDYNNLKKDIEKSGEVRDALKCYQDEEGDYLLLAGSNRLKIATELNIELVPVQIFKGSIQEYRELVINDNVNRRHLTGEQKKKLAEYFIKQDPKESNRTIAKKSGVSKDTVNTVRNELETGGEISHQTETKGKDGKVYKKPEKKPDIKPVKTPAAADPKKSKVQESKKATVKEITERIKNYIDQELSRLDKKESAAVYNLIIKDLEKNRNKIEVK